MFDNVALVLVLFVLAVIAIYILARFVFQAYFHAKKDFLRSIAKGEEMKNGSTEEN